jgi:Protein of unknown function (DUF3134)
MYNPSLHEEPLHQSAPVIPLKHESSILDWLEATGRLLAREDAALEAGYLDEADEEISDLMGVDEVGYDDIDDDDDDVVELE